MQRFPMKLLALMILGLLGLLSPTLVATGQNPTLFAACKTLAFSTEEDFLTRGPLPPDGNPIISDGDLLGPNHAVCARNQALLAKWEVKHDLGLDAVDVLDVERPLVVFSTELNDPSGRFTQGDLLSTAGMIIPNAALLVRFQLRMDLGLDAVHLVGDRAAIIDFLDKAAEVPRDAWLAERGLLIERLQQAEIDIWFSTEGTAPAGTPNAFLDGDLLSVRDGLIVLSQNQLLDPPIPAGLPNRGVDFGLDALTASRTGDRTTVRLSGEILYRDVPSFTDGDVLQLGGAVVIKNETLVNPFEPLADFLGLDAFYQQVEAGAESELNNTYLPLVVKK